MLISTEEFSMKSTTDSYSREQTALTLIPQMPTEIVRGGLGK
jgi:hypothetical protein